MDIIEKRANKPFILTKSNKTTLLPRDYQNFNESAESYIRFVQGANTFVTFFLIYETVQTLYYHFAYLSECQTYSIMLLAVMGHNALWFMTSICGFYYIKSKSSRKIIQYFLVMIFIFLARIGVYVVLHLSMKEVSVDKFYCDAVYQGGLYLMQGMIEGSFFVLMLPMIWVIYRYIAEWELTQYKDPILLN